MKAITVQLLEEQLKDDHKSNVGCGVVCLVLAVFFLCGIAVNPLVGLVMTAVFGGLAWSSLRSGRNTQKNLQKRAYRLVPSVCTNKVLLNGGEDPDTRMLSFANGCNRDLTQIDANINSEVRNPEILWLYDTTQVGDRFYLVYMEGEETPIFIISQRLCRLDPHGFVEYNGCLRPR